MAKCKYCGFDAPRQSDEDCPNNPNRREAKFPIGQQFKTRGKAPKLCTVIDILRTYNDAGELVKIRYVATHEFAGQTVTDHDVPETTVAMGVQS